MLDANPGLSPFDPAVLALFEAMPEPVWVAYPDGRIAFVNAKGLDQLGLTAQDALENGLMDRLHPDEREFVVARVAHTLQTGEPFDVEARLRSNDGNYRWNRSRASAVRDDSGAIAAFVGHLIDIDRYKAAEVEARNAESRLRLLIDAPIVGFVRLDMQRTVLDCNDTFATMLGYTKSELCGQNLGDMTPPEWHSVTYAAMDEARGSGRTGPFKKEYLRTDGARVPVLVTGALDPADAACINSYVIDLSTESQYREAFQRARDINQTLLDSMPVIFWTADAGGTVNYWNRWFYEYTGIAPERALSDDYWHVIHPDDVQSTGVEWRSSGYRDPEIKDRLIRYRRGSDGSYRWHHVHAEPLLGERGDVTGWLGYSIDMHEERRAAERGEFLLHATERVAGILEPAELFERVVRDCIPMMGDSAVLFMLQDGRLQPAAIAALDAEREATLRRLHATFGAGPEASPIKSSLRERRSILLEQFGPEAVDALPATPEEKALLRGLHTKSLIATPLFDRDGAAMGVLLVNNGPSGRVHDAQDVQTLRILGERIAVSYENAQRYKREHRVAEALQEASLPHSLPAPRGMNLYAFYAAAPSEANIGGDWYDAMELDDGRVVLSIGDVTGQGLDAAVIMSKVRQIIRGVAHVHPDPALMLEAADRALRAEHPETYVTTVAAVIDPIESSLTYASAGHPPPVLRRANGEVVLLREGGLPLGLRARQAPRVASLPIATGDALFFYTDGITEVHRRPGDGEAALVREIERGDVLRSVDPARALHDALVGTEARDDIAVLVLAVGELRAATDSCTFRRWAVDVRDEEAVRAIRGSVVAEIESCAGEEAGFRTSTIFGELVGNALRYTPGNTEIIFERRRNTAILHLLDDGEGFQFVPKLPSDAYSERGRGLYITAALADDFSVTRRPDGGSHARAVIAYRRTSL